MVNEAGSPRLAIVERLLQGIEYELGPGRTRHPPAHDPAGEDVDHESHIDEARPGRHIGEVAHPQGVRPRRRELPVDPVAWAWCRGIADGGPNALAPHHTLQAHLPHQPGDRAACDLSPFALQLAPDLAHAIDAEVFRKDPADLLAEVGIPALAGRPAVGIGLARGVLVV